MSPAESFLLTLPRFADVGAAALKPGLERIRTLLDGMGMPQQRYPAVLVAGTNGKGSAASMLAAIATAAGKRTGLHTSPHLFTLRERMRVDGVPAGEEWLEDAVARHRDLIERAAPSFFEATVAFSLLYFAEREVDLAVVEVGLGGRLDATNVLEPELCLITRIARDHEEFLGDTLGAIAREKAGIAREGVPLLTSEGPGEALDAIRSEAARRGAAVEAVRDTCAAEVIASGARGLAIDLRTPDGHYGGLRVTLPGRHQAWNAALAVRAAEHVLPAASERGPAVRRGLSEVRGLAGLTGRCQVIRERPLAMVDVAHNPDGLAATLDVFASLAPGVKTVVLGLSRDKHPAEVARLFARPDLRVACVELPGERALSVAELRGHLVAAGANVLDASGIDESVRRFLREAGSGDGLLATGSHQVVAMAIAALGSADRPTTE